MDLNTGQRTFCYYLSGVNALNSTTSVPFQDSAGNVIKCNYVNVQLNVNGTAGQVGSLIVELSGISAGDAEDLSLGHPAANTVPASGVCGFSMAGVARGKPAEYTWCASNGDEPAGLKLFYRGDAAANIAITYGTVRPRNVLRSKEMYDRGL